MSTRREFFRQTGTPLLGVLFSFPNLSFPFLEEKTVFIPEWERAFNEFTFWEAKNMLVYLLETGSQKVLYTLQINGVDCQLLNPFLGKPKTHLDFWETDDRPRFRRTQTRDIFAVVPNVTGIPAQYLALAGCLSDQKTFCFSGETHQPEKVLASYLVIGRYYDNKTVNASEAVLSLASNPRRNTIPPEGIFSYIQATRIRELEEDKNRILMGKGLYPSTSKPGESELGKMFAGGICVSAAVIGKMARQAEVKNLVKITRISSHGQDKKWWYFMNPDDPTPNQVDATIYWPTNKDLQFQNLTQQTLYLVPKIQIIADPLEKVPENYNGLEQATAFFVLSVSLQTAPIKPEEIDSLENQIKQFRQSRNI